MNTSQSKSADKGFRMKAQTSPTIGSRIVAASQWISIIKNGIWVVGGAVFVMSGITALLVASFGSPLLRKILVAVLVFLAFGIGVLIGGYLFRKVSFSRDTVLGYRVISEEHDYRFSSDPRMQTKILTTIIEARHREVSIIEYRYYWSGQGDQEDYPSVTVEGGGADVIQNPRWTQKIFHVFYVRLHHPVLKGNYREIRTVFKMKDSAGKFQPYLVKNVFDWMHELTLIVRFPEEIMPSQISGYKGRAGDHAKRKLFPIEQDNYGRTYTLHVISPRIKDVYGIEWEWDYSNMIETLQKGEDMNNG